MTVIVWLKIFCQKYHHSRYFPVSCRKVAVMTPKKESRVSRTKTVYCSFCGKSQHEVNKIIAGPTTAICDECITLCDDIILAETHQDRIIVKVLTPNGSEFDDVLYQSVARAIGDDRNGLGLKYECKSIPSYKSDEKILLIFSYNKEYVASAQKSEASISEELSNKIRDCAILQQRYVNESERVKDLTQELSVLKEEYLGFLRSYVNINKEKTDLAAVAFVDIKGFSLALLDEKKRMLNLLRGIVPVFINGHGAQHVNMWGDGIVAIFHDVNEAVECAIKFSRHLEVERLEARIGMAWGRVRVAYNPAIGRADIDGAVVDLAARIEPLADVGEILLSKEFGGLDLDSSLGSLVPVKRIVKKAFASFNVGDTMELYKLNVARN